MKKIFITFATESLRISFEDFNLSNEWLINNYKSVSPHGRFVELDEFIQMVNSDQTAELSVWGLTPLEYFEVTQFTGQKKVLFFYGDDALIVETTFPIASVVEEIDDCGEPFLVLRGESPYEFKSVERRLYFGDTPMWGLVGDDGQMIKVFEGTLLDEMGTSIGEFNDKLSIALTGADCGLENIRWDQTGEYCYEIEGTLSSYFADDIEIV